MLLLNQGQIPPTSREGFLSKYAAMLDIALRIGDIVIVAAAAMLAEFVRFGHWGLTDHYYLTGVVRVGLLTIILFPAFNLYRSWRGAPLLAEALRITLAMIAVGLCALTLAWALKITGHYSRIWLGTWFLTAWTLLVASRLTVRGILGFVRSHGIDMRDVVLIGATEAGAKILKATREHPYMGLHIKGYVTTPYDKQPYDDIPRLDGLDHYIENIAQDPPDQLWIALPMGAEKDIQQLMDATSNLPLQIRLVPDFFGYEMINHRSGSVASVPIITLRGSRIEGHARVTKAIEDRLLALIFLIVLSPLMLLIALLVKCTSSGPVFFMQKRHGLGGTEITVLKFRSMRLHDETPGTVTQATPNDDRVTWIGRILRRSSLDELPQLFNVLAGSMSIVGPRPHAVEHNRAFAEQLKDYMQRHGMKPGITGLAQINGFRGRTDTLAKIRKRVEQDIEYMQCWSLWLDLKIILMTPLALLRRTNAY